MTGHISQRTINSSAAWTSGRCAATHQPRSKQLDPWVQWHNTSIYTSGVYFSMLLHGRMSSDALLEAVCTLTTIYRRCPICHRSQRHNKARAKNRRQQRPKIQIHFWWCSSGRRSCRDRTTPMVSQNVQRRGGQDDDACIFRHN